MKRELSVTYREHLDRAGCRGCKHPGCDCHGHSGLYFLSSCHGSPFLPCYDSMTGLLTFECATCGERGPVMAIASVDEGEDYGEPV